MNIETVQLKSKGEALNENAVKECNKLIIENVEIEGQNKMESALDNKEETEYNVTDNETKRRSVKKNDEKIEDVPLDTDTEHRDKGKRVMKEKVKGKNVEKKRKKTDRIEKGAVHCEEENDTKIIESNIKQTLEREIHSSNDKENYINGRLQGNDNLKTYEKDNQDEQKHTLEMSEPEQNKEMTIQFNAETSAGKRIMPEVTGSELQNERDVKLNNYNETTALNGQFDMSYHEKQEVKDFSLNSSQNSYVARCHIDITRNEEGLGRKIQKNTKGRTSESAIEEVSDSKFEPHYRKSKATFTGRDNFDIMPKSPKAYLGERCTNKCPVFSTCLFDKETIPSSNVTLSCTVLISESVEIKWFKNDKQLTQDENCKMIFRNGVAELEIRKTSVSDEGEYKCEAINTNGVSSTRAYLTVRSEKDTKYQRVGTFSETYEKSDNRLTLDCRIKCRQPHYLKWFKNDEEISLNGRYILNYLDDGIARLVISNPSEEDTGTYTCRAADSALTENLSHSLKFAPTKYSFDVPKSIYPKESSSILSKIPYFAKSLSDHVVPLGGVMALQVEVKGEPSEITWFKESQKLIASSSRHRTFEERGVHTLIIPNINEYEAGKYTCRAVNAYGKTETTSYVNVLHPSSVRDGKPAMFMSRPDKVLNVNLGEDVSVSFRISGDPKPKIILMKGLTDITEGSKSFRETSDDYNRFTLKALTEKDMGTYCIMAKNFHGCDRAFFTLTLRKRARSETPTRDNTPKDILDDIPSYSERNYLKGEESVANSNESVTDKRQGQG
ncbi:hypothetical protein WA026_018449 [Henosepilachna vigintioctopunctata]|uniref:Ig-like domain-containing protein n=1 Tax=Henosepilachna vigintioctopunctata TaxID=420089 RepID=A0AAW1UTE7_9CUCU